MEKYKKKLNKRGVEIKLNLNKSSQNNKGLFV